MVIGLPPLKKKLRDSERGGRGLTVWGGDPRRCPHVRNFYNFHIENHVILEPIIIS